MKKTNKYYSMATANKEADVFIFGDIVCPEDEWYESDTSGYSLAKDIRDLDVNVIHVHINSYGGHVSEGLAIYNTLKQHKAKIITYDDGFACSAASVVFMSGDERIMRNASLLMIHNAWNLAIGNAEELRKAADDLDKIMQASINAYMEAVSITEDELKKLLNDETWLTPQEALDMGFATSIISAASIEDKVAASARKSAFNLIIKGLANVPNEENNKLLENPNDPPADPVPDPDPDPEPEPEPGPQENKVVNLMAALFR